MDSDILSRSSFSISSKRSEEHTSELQSRLHLVCRLLLEKKKEIFMCGTGVQVSPVTSVDRRLVKSGNPGPMTMRLQELYLSACLGENEKYKDWVTPVYA